MRYFFWLALVFIILAVLFNLFVSFGVVTSASSIVASISSFVSKNKFIFLVWHIFLYISIFTGLYAYATYMIKTNNLPDVKRKEAIKLCYLATFIVIILDIVYILGRG